MMQANEFVKKFGWDEAKKLIALDGWKNTPFLVRVKRLVESKAWVAEHGTIERAKEYANSPYTAPEIKELASSYCRCGELSMNLVEELGGYKKLRPHFILTDSALGYTHVYLHGNNHYCFLDDRVDYIIPARAFSIKEVIDALLEYRRQHNIYEVGDYVLFPIACEKGGKYFGKIIDYRSDINQFDVLGSRHWGWFTSSELQHANDAEIEANRRLDCEAKGEVL